MRHFMYWVYSKSNYNLIIFFVLERSRNAYILHLQYVLQEYTVYKWYKETLRSQFPTQKRFASSWRAYQNLREVDKLIYDKRLLTKRISNITGVFNRLKLFSMIRYTNYGSTTCKM